MILNSMAELHFITGKELATAKAQKLSFHTYINPARKYQQYTAEIVELCQRMFHTDDVYRDGIKVYTNMDPAAQEAAERVITNGIKGAPKGINQGALVSINVADGGIIAMVGGVGKNAEWNRATSPHTAGSAFKPFVYLAALGQGSISPDDMVADAPLEIKQAGAPVYRPKNFDGSYMGDMTIRKAIALSRNTCAVRVAQQVGPHEIARYAHLAGINSKLDENLSLALGSSAVSPLEMANAYATLARGGQYLDPLMVRRVVDRNGRVLEEFKQRHEQVFDQEPVAEVVDALQDVVEKGTGTRARLFDRPVAGKTGTADAAKDVWFVGFTPDVATAVWGGNDDNKPVPGHVSGGSVMAGIWHNYMAAYYSQHNIPAGEFTPPQHPLLEDPEPLQIWPAPSNLMNQLFGGFFQPPAGPVIREYDWRPKRQQTHYTPPQEAQPKPKKKGLLKKLFGWLSG
jgi:penicillin-binding protein 1A